VNEDGPGRRDRRGANPTAGLDTPRTRTRGRIRLRPQVDPESFGRGAERFARFMGTARFLVYMSAFVAVWLAWNTLAPEDAQWDKAALNYTLLTLILSLQASYAAPLILLAQNRQDDRDRVQGAQDRAESARALADTEFLTREVAALKIALREVATRDFLRSELRSMLEELDERRDEDRREDDPRDLDPTEADEHGASTRGSTGGGGPRSPRSHSTGPRGTGPRGTGPRGTGSRSTGPRGGGASGTGPSDVGGLQPGE